MHSCLTQIFNDKGEGTILRGGMAHKSEEDREVHLPKDAATKLLDNAIQNYMSANDDRLPDRVVIHKSSGYNAAEQDGFNEVTDRSGVKFRDLLALGRSNIRLFRHGPYPPLRGTHIILDDENSLLYTRGSVPILPKISWTLRASCTPYSVFSDGPKPIGASWGDTGSHEAQLEQNAV